MTQHALDLATALEGDPAAPRRQAHTSDAYWTFIGPFGGSSAATALRAVLEHPSRQGDPLALTVNFCAPIARGGFEVAVRLARANRSSQHWTVEFTQGESREAVLTATVVTAARRDSFSHQFASPPQIPGWESLPTLPNPSRLSWVSQYEFRFAEGLLALSETPPDPPGSPRSLLWLRDAPARPLDFVSLTAMSDAFFGRIFQVIGRIPPFGTVSMTTCFHAGADELAAHGDAPLAGVADARIFHRSFGDQSVELWSGAGKLLATGTQMAYFRF
jgi:acyl-CoA thioesterase